MLTTDWSWKLGRQGTGYQKLLLAQGSWWDCYLLKYPQGAFIPEHLDPVPGKRHYRLNILLKGEYAFFYRTDALNSIWRFWRFTFFRPDVTPHGIMWVNNSRWVLSIGWVR